MRNFLFIILLFNVFTLYSQVKYYKSNKSATPIVEVTFSNIDDYEYILSFERLDNSSVKTLLKYGIEQKKWIIVYNNQTTWTETEYNKDKTLVNSYYENKKLVKEELFFENKISEIREYTYRQNELEKVIVKSGEGVIKFTNNYLRGVNGRLLRVTTSFPDGTNNYSSYKFTDTDLTNQIHKYANFAIQYNYIKGDLISVEEFLDDNLVYKKTIDNGISIEKYIKDNKSIWKTLDENGRVISEILSEGYNKIETLYKYDINGNISEKLIKSSGKRELYKYQYKEKKLSNSFYYINEDLVKIDIHENQQKRSQLVFRNRLPFILIKFVDNIEVESNVLNEEEVAAYLKEFNLEE